jgi:hypothetical protein
MEVSGQPYAPAGVGIDSWIDMDFASPKVVKVFVTEHSDSVVFSVIETLIVFV